MPSRCRSRSGYLSSGRATTQMPRSASRSSSSAMAPALARSATMRWAWLSSRPSPAHNRYSFFPMRALGRLSSEPASILARFAQLRGREGFWRPAVRPTLGESNAEEDDRPGIRSKLTTSHVNYLQACQKKFTGRLSSGGAWPVLDVAGFGDRGSGEDDRDSPTAGNRAQLTGPTQVLLQILRVGRHRLVDVKGAGCPFGRRRWNRDRSWRRPPTDWGPIVLEDHPGMQVCLDGDSSRKKGQGVIALPPIVTKR